MHEPERSNGGLVLRANTGTLRLAFRGLILSLTVLGSQQVLAIPASPLPCELEQPDGTKITLRVRGGPAVNWFEDDQGFSVVCENGEYKYAACDGSGHLAATQLRVGCDDPQAMGLSPDAAASAHGQSCSACALPGPPEGDGPDQTAPEGGPVPVPASGTVKNLVVLCKFSDHTFGVHTRAEADYDTLYNAVGGDVTLAPTGSVRDVFTENSYGTMTLESTVVAWVTLPQAEAYYGNGQNGTGMTYPQNAQGMVRDALDLVDALVDFGQFDQDDNGFVDAISVVHSGYGAETGGGGGNWVWSHKWSLWALPGGQWTSADTNGSAVNVKVSSYHTEPALWGTSGNQISRIGVAAHEAGHFFGLPDLYDTNGGSRGIGSWGMMANSWGLNGSQQYPPHFSAWSKIQLGWVTPTILSSPGNYAAPRVQTTATIFKITSGYPSGEYLLVENRQPYGFDGLLPQGGLAIWHIDENKAGNTDQGYPGQSGWPGNNSHYKIALLQADGQYHLEKNSFSADSGDVYHAGGVSAINGSTVPNTDTYQGGVVNATNVSISNVSASGNSMTFDFSNTSGAADITSPTDGATFTASSQAFIWSAGTGVTQYWLEVGTAASPGAYSSADMGTGQSQTVNGLPTDGSAVQVRLWSLIGGSWSINTYNYTAVTQASAAATMTSPTDGATFTASSQAFAWSAGTGVSSYWLEVGTPSSPGAYLSADMGASQSYTANGLPTDGSAVQVRLWSLISGSWTINTYNYTAVTQASAAATMTSPTDGATFTASSQAFAWSAGTGVSSYWLEAGTPSSPGAYLSADMGTSQSYTVNGLPTDGSAVRVRLWSLIGGSWTTNTYNYTAVTQASAAATMTSPTDGATFTASSQAFAWSAGTGVSSYWLEVGTPSSPGAYLSASMGTSQSYTANSLPTDGSASRVRLWSLIGSSWTTNTYNYTAVTQASSGATMTSPTDGATFTASSQAFAWTAGTGVSQYWLEVGTPSSPGAFLSASMGTSQSYTANGLPTDGSSVRVLLWSLIGSSWTTNTYNYTAVTQASASATMTSPTDGATFTASSQAFAWSAGTGVSSYWLEAGTPSSPGAYLSADMGTSQSYTVSGLPTDGSAVRVRLWSLIGGSWTTNTYNYTAVTQASAAAAMTSPTDGATFASSSQAFSWTAGTGVSQYWLEVGTASSPAAYFSGDMGTSQSHTVNGLPVSGAAIQVRLWSLIGGSWSFNTYNYTGA